MLRNSLQFAEHFGCRSCELLGEDLDDRGWKGDIPIVRFNTERICGLGWRCRLSSREALRASLLALIKDARAGLI